MKLQYYPETDTLYIEMRDEPSAATREFGPDVTVDYAEDAGIVGLTIEHASERTSLDSIEVTDIRNVHVQTRRDASTSQPVSA